MVTSTLVHNLNFAVLFVYNQLFLATCFLFILLFSPPVCISYFTVALLVLLTRCCVPTLIWTTYEVVLHQYHMFC